MAKIIIKNKKTLYPLKQDSYNSSFIILDWNFGSMYQKMENSSVSTHCQIRGNMIMALSTQVLLKMNTNKYVIIHKILKGLEYG